MSKRTYRDWVERARMGGIVPKMDRAWRELSLPKTFECPHCSADAVTIDEDNDCAKCEHCSATWETIASLLEETHIRTSEESADKVK